MSLNEILISQSREFIKSSHKNCREILELKLNVVENPIRVFPRDKSYSYKLSGSFENNDNHIVEFYYFLKIARKNEIVTLQILDSQTHNVIPKLYSFVPLDTDNNVYLAFCDYIENTPSLWLLLNSLRLNNEQETDYHNFAKEILKVLGRKIAALHYLLNEKKLVGYQNNHIFRRISQEEINDFFDKGIMFLNSDFAKPYLQNSKLVSALEKLRSTIINNILTYPLLSLLHGDLQVFNIIWNPNQPNQFYFIDWDKAFIGPGILDLYTFCADFQGLDFINAYIDTLKQLCDYPLNLKTIKPYLDSIIIYQSLKLASQSHDIIKDDRVKQGILTTLFTRISNVAEIQ